MLLARFNPLNAIPITPTYIRSIGDAGQPLFGGSMVLTQSYDDIYIGGGIDGDLLLVKLKASDGSSKFEVTTNHNLGASPNKQIISLAVREGFGTNY